MTRATFPLRQRAKVDAAYQAFIAQGFPLTLEGNAETLQCATDTDRSNWLIFKGALDDALLSGAKPGDPVPIPLRCTSNASYTVNFAQAFQIISDMRTWGFAAQVNCWRLKDAVDAAKSNAELNAIDLTEGWP